MLLGIVAFAMHRNLRSGVLAALLSAASCLLAQSPEASGIPGEAAFRPAGSEPGAVPPEPARFTPRPAPPAGGYPLQVDLFVPVSYSDGYVTYGSLLAPEGTPPPGGWPLVVFLHQLGQSRGENLGFQQLVASQGYAVWNYDVRAHGQALAGNVGHPHAGSTLWGPNERLDLAEQLAFVAGHEPFAGLVDAGRVGLVGKSQGAAHAWQAAAWAGTEVIAPGRPDLVFPPVACAVALDLVPDTPSDWLRSGVLFSNWFVELISGTVGSLPVDEVFLASCREGFVEQDPAVLREQFAAEQRDLIGRLRDSTVPVLYSHAYLDNVNSPLLGVEMVEARAAPQHVILGGVGHGVASNLVELSFRQDVILRWLHRFLWQEPNDVDAESRFTLAERPLAPAALQDVRSPWRRSHVADVRPAVAPTTLHLRPDGSLATDLTADLEGEQVHRIRQRVSDQLTAKDYLERIEARQLDAVLGECPLDERVYSHRIAAACQLARSPRVRLSVVPRSAAWMLAVALTVQVDPDRREVLLAANAIGSRSSTPGGRELHSVRLPPVAVRLPAGAVVRLHLRNLWLRDPPMGPGLEVAPVFADFDVDVLLGSPEGQESWLELPIDSIAPRLVADCTTLALATPVPVNLRLDGGLARAGRGYFAVVGASGQLPSTPFLNANMPVAFDWLVAGSAGANGGVLTGGSGVLDDRGRASIGYDLTARAPLSQLLNGQRLTFAAFVWDADGATGAASNPWDVGLR